MANGQIPSSMLGPIPGSNAGLLKPAAMAYRAMHLASVQRLGISLVLIDGSIGRCYRSFARQVIARNFWCSLGKCGNAAIPGTSNHGLGTTVDLMTTAQRSAIDRIGAAFGYSKSWSDASWEWWHIRYQGGHYTPRPDPLAKLGRRRRSAASLLLYRRRERMREGRTGHGARWRRWDRAVKRSYRKVALLWHRCDDPAQKAVLLRALDDRDGRL